MTQKFWTKETVENYMTETTGLLFSAFRHNMIASMCVEVHKGGESNRMMLIASRRPDDAPEHIPALTPLLRLLTPIEVNALKNDTPPTCVHDMAQSFLASSESSNYLQLTTKAIIKALADDEVILSHQEWQLGNEGKISRHMLFAVEGPSGRLSLAEFLTPWEARNLADIASNEMAKGGVPVQEMAVQEVTVH